MNTTLIDQAIKKYPKAKRIAVENFTMGYDGPSLEARMNLESDARCYSWNGHTINAILYVLSYKPTFNTMVN